MLSLTVDKNIEVYFRVVFVRLSTMGLEFFMKDRKHKVLPCADGSFDVHETFLDLIKYWSWSPT